MPPSSDDVQTPLAITDVKQLTRLFGWMLKIHGRHGRSEARTRRLFTGKACQRDGLCVWLLAKSDLPMNSDAEKDAETTRFVRAASGALAVVAAVPGIFRLVHSGDWSLLCGAVLLGSHAWSYRADKDTKVDISPGRLLAVLAICFLLPLVLLLAYGDRPGWTKPLVWLFFIVGAEGTILFLRGRIRRPE